MSENKNNAGAAVSNWAGILWLILPLALAIVYKIWVLTALPIGLLFGFFLQKGDLCGASAFSENLLMKDRKKVWGLWIAIVTAMGVFAVLDLMGLVTLNPKPFLWLSALTGGVIFGVGTVLAGGCVSGCLFKSGTGNLNSMAALPGIALGIGIVEFGLLKPFQAALKIHVLKAPNGGAMTLSTLTRMPFWLLALIFILITLAVAWQLKKRNPGKSRSSLSLSAGRWKPWQAGLLIGLLGGAAYLSSAASGRNYPLGVSHGVLHTRMLLSESPLTYVTQPPSGVQVKDKVKPADLIAGKAKPTKKVSVWLILVVSGLVMGAWVSARQSGIVKLQAKPPEQVVTAFFGGCLVGVGAAIAQGCVVGNILSGWALMSLGSIFFGVMVVLSNWAATYFYLMGGTVKELLTWKK